MRPKNRVYDFLFLKIMLMAIFFSTGCASMFGDSTDTVEITSEPAGADVYFRKKHLGTTPLTVALERRVEASQLQFEKTGYKPKNVPLSRHVTGKAFWNFGFITTTSGATSWGVDALSGKMWEYSPKSYVVNLEKIETQVNTDALFDYVMSNGELIRKSLAQKQSQILDDMCAAASLKQNQCSKWQNEILRRRATLLKTKNNLELYKALPQN